MTDQNIQAIQLHPLCTYFPRMSDAEFISLKANIQDIGQTHPIYTLNGMILDGGNRYRALCELGIKPVMIEYTGSNPTQFILSSNLHRRHLTQGQAAAIVSASQSWVKAQVADDEKLANSAPLDTTESRAKQSGVGQRTQQMADKLVKEAPAELVKEVIDGKKSLTKAIKEISPPKPVTPKPEPVPVIDQQLQEDHQEQLSSIIEEQQGVIKTLEADNIAMRKVFESDDKVFASFEEVKALTELNRGLNERITGLTTEKDEAVKAAAYWKDQFLTLEIELDKHLEK
ncbi:MAG: hypothetical protein WCS87_12915 [Methylococcaceae bacterium]